MRPHDEFAIFCAYGLINDLLRRRAPDWSPLRTNTPHGARLHLAAFLDDLAACG